MKKFAVVCINAKNRPADFPEHLWIAERTELYHVIAIHRMAKQPGTYGFVLEERDLSSLTKYDSFAHHRFRPATEDDLEAIKEMEALFQEITEDELVILD
jgi:hypothetical protein